MGIGTPDTSRPQALRVVTGMRARVAADRALPGLGWVEVFACLANIAPHARDSYQGATL